MTIMNLKKEIENSEIFTFLPTDGIIPISLDIPIVDTTIKSLIIFQNVISEACTENGIKFHPYLNVDNLEKKMVI